MHGIPGLAPGGYAYTGETSYEGRTRSDDARAYGARLCLDQPLGGDSAYTVFHAAPLDLLVAALGGRAFRAAMLEAGLVAGRLALNATALQGGATGLTFYDGLVGQLLSHRVSPLLATAVGVPATRPAPSGLAGRTRRTAAAIRGSWPAWPPGLSPADRSPGSGAAYRPDSCRARRCRGRRPSVGSTPSGGVGNTPETRRSAVGDYGLKVGTPEIRSVGPITFGPDDILFVADNATSHGIRYRRGRSGRRRRR